MNYTEYQPSRKLREIVKNYWRFFVAEDCNISFPLKHETLPHSEVSIVFIKQPYFEGIRMLGPHIKKFEKTIYANSIYFGIRFLPWISFSPILFNKQQILNLTADCPIVISNYLEPVKFEDCSKAEELIPKIEQCLVKLFTKAIQITQNDYIKYICLELSSGKSVGSTISNLPLSTRVLQKKFKEVVGMSMRDYNNIVRQRRLWTDLVKNNKSKLDLIYEHGFFDQSHFINDFKKQMHQSHTDFEERLKQITISLA